MTHTAVKPKGKVGGARPGAGRKPKPDAFPTRSFEIWPEQAAWLDVSGRRSAVVREALAYAMTHKSALPGDKHASGRPWLGHSPMGTVTRSYTITMDQDAWLEDQANGSEYSRSTYLRAALESAMKRAKTKAIIDRPETATAVRKLADA